MTDPDILALRGELAVMAFECSHTHVTHVARWIDCAEYGRAVKALELALPFWKAALDEMRVIRAAVQADDLTGEAAVEWRAQRDAKRGRAVA